MTGGVVALRSVRLNLRYDLALYQPHPVTVDPRRTRGPQGLHQAKPVLQTFPEFPGAIEGEIRSHEYQREVAVGTQRTAIPQRVWEIRVDSVLKLDRAAKRESNDDSHEEVPR